MIKRTRVALRLARRELRQGLSGFRIFLACLILGVASIAGVGSLSEALLEGLSRQGRELLGGDVEIRMTQREMGKDERAWLNTQGRVSMTAEMRAMAIAQGNDARRSGRTQGRRQHLSALRRRRRHRRASRYASSSPTAKACSAPPSMNACWPSSASRKAPSSRSARALRAALVLRQEPDRVAGGFTLGPRVLISEFALRATGLVQPGSLINFNYRVALAGRSDELAPGRRRNGSTSSTRNSPTPAGRRATAGTRRPACAVSSSKSAPS